MWDGGTPRLGRILAGPVTSPERAMKTRTQKAVARLVLAVGVVLLGYMVVVEGEPGLLPLLLVVVGGGWYAAVWLGQRVRARAAYRAGR